MGLRLQQLKETLHFPQNEFIDEKWYTFVLANTEDCTKRMIGIKKLKDDIYMNTKSVISYLYKYFDKIEKDSCQLDNMVCSVGCCSCCTSDFEVSIVEYFAILRYIGVRFGENYIKSLSEQAKISLTLQHCLFVDDTNGSCRIYEVRPLICRKYGLYDEATDCVLLNDTKLLDDYTDTSKNTIVFSHSAVPKQPIMLSPKRLVYWFSNMENGKFKTQRMKDLFYASFDKDIDEFIEILLK